MRRERFREVHQLVVKLCPGIIFPTPYPQGYGVTPPPPRPPQKRARRWREHARACPRWQCRLCRTRASEGANTVGRPVFRDGRRPPGGPGGEALTRSLLATPPPGRHPGTGRRGGPPAIAVRAEPRDDALTGGRRGPGRRPTGPARPPPTEARHPRFSCPTAHRSVMRPCGTLPRSTPQRPATPLRGGPNTSWFTAARERTGAAVRRRLCARRDRIQHTQPMVLGQLHLGAEPFAGWPDTPPPTRQERTARYAFTRRGRATLSKGTSLCASRVKRFVIERFTPRFLIDIELVGEGVTAGPRDAVDSILEIGDWGHVQHRGETCRSDRPVRTRETRTPRGA